MSDILRVQWTIIPQIEPQPWLVCGRCGGIKPFRTSRMFRLNANGKRLDAWLIYRCATCENSWNRPVLERRPVRAVTQSLLAALQSNEPDLARQVAFDVQDLRRRQQRVEEFPDALVRKDVLAGDARSAHRIEIGVTVADPTSLRADRLLATELGLSRGRIENLLTADGLRFEPNDARALRKSVRHGTRVVIELSDAVDRERIACAAAGLSS